MRQKRDERKGTLSEPSGGDELENRVEKLRKERGLNQEEFARAICVSRQTVSSIETGKYNPSLDLAFAIADFFGKTIEEIFIHEGGTERAEREAFLAYGRLCIIQTLNPSNSTGLGRKLAYMLSPCPLQNGSKA